MKISEVLLEINSHGIYGAEEFANRFKAETGLEPCWPVHSASITKQEITARGLGGEIDKDLGQCVWGWEVAEALAAKYANGFTSNKFGRGSAFRECIEALTKVGH